MYVLTKKQQKIHGLFSYSLQINIYEYFEIVLEICFLELFYKNSHMHTNGCVMCNIRMKYLFVLYCFYSYNRNIYMKMSFTANVHNCNVKSR